MIIHVTLGQSNIDALAEAIADELMINAFGAHAVRLALLTDDGKDLGGWNRTGLVKAITRAFGRNSLIVQDSTK